MNATEELVLEVNGRYNIKYFVDHSRDAGVGSSSYIYYGTRWVDNEVVLVFGEAKKEQRICIPSDLIQTIEEIENA